MCPVQELVDSGDVRDEPAALAQRLGRDGYLFFRRLLPTDVVNAAGKAVFDALHTAGWVDARGVPSPVRRALNSRDAAGDPGFRAARSDPAFHRVAFLPPLTDVVHRLLGPEAFVYPVKVLRAQYREAPPGIARGRYVHQDYGVGAVRDMVTAWVPLMEIPVELGGLAVHPGSQLGPPEPHHRLQSDEPGWATAHYRVGDVLLFHCLTSHAALPNRINWLRISTDFRFQPIEEVAPAELIYGPLRHRRELFSRVLEAQPWWHPVPAAARVAPQGERAELPPTSSRFFPVHPGWGSWQPKLDERRRRRPVH